MFRSRKGRTDDDAAGSVQTGSAGTGAEHGRKMLAPVPPMGWNSWNTFHQYVDDALIRQTADAMVKSGLKDAGYEYVIIDDCWSMPRRDNSGRLVPDPSKFPKGIEPLAEYVHSKGLKFGMYSCCGTLTCAGYPGSFEHEYDDAAQFAAWGVDYLKYDNCHKPASIGDPILYKRMGTALRNCGRDIVFAACQWGTEDVWRWIRSTGANTFRSTGDIVDGWKSVCDIARSQLDKQCFSGPDCFNDMDMLVVGMRGNSRNNLVAAAGGCTDTEYETHFALWAIMSSPLIIGCDVRHMTGRTADILMNRDLIAINQDPGCRPCWYVTSGNRTVLIRQMSDGDIVLGFFNFEDNDSTVEVDFWDIGLSAGNCSAMSFYDCTFHEDAGVHSEHYGAMVPAHGSHVYRCRPV